MCFNFWFEAVAVYEASRAVKVPSAAEEVVQLCADAQLSGSF